MAISTMRGDIAFVGECSFSDINLSAGCVSDSNVNGSAAIGAAKVIHQFPVSYDQAAGADVASQTRLVHIARGAGTLVEVQVTDSTAPTGGDKQYTVDVKKSTAGGAFASVLTSVVTRSAADTSRVVESATITTASYIADDIYQVVVTASGSTGSQGQGVVVTLWLQENPS